MALEVNQIINVILYEKRGKIVSMTKKPARILSMEHDRFAVQALSGSFRPGQDMAWLRLDGRGRTWER